jgi:hypothetical protein
MVMSGQLHALAALSLVTEPLVPILNQSLGGPQSHCGCFGDLLHLTGVEP